ncbi:transcriptional regulator with XRE-family HTH domain [Constrictibacter sp. MBR-5]|uniref:hypothetical protein n=1 Tax=Constrictibacter sp. MBR-5 TaxID=3156467 RepID=UPI00339678B0
MSPLDGAAAPDPFVQHAIAVSPPRPSGDGSRVATPAAWTEAAIRIARGDTLVSVADRLGCSRSTLWRVLQRSERLRTRIAEERRFLAVAAASRFRGLHAAAVDAIETAVRRGDLRAAFWVADRLGIARTDIGDADAGLALAADAAAWGEGPPVDAALFALDTPLELEPGVEAEPPEIPAPAPEAVAPQADAAANIAPAAVPATPPATLRETSSRRRSKTFHTAPASPFERDLLRRLPRTAAAWPAATLAGPLMAGPIMAELLVPERRRAG